MLYNLENNRTFLVFKTFLKKISIFKYEDNYLQNFNYFVVVLINKLFINSVN